MSAKTEILKRLARFVMRQEMSDEALGRFVRAAASPRALKEIGAISHTAEVVSDKRVAAGIRAYLEPLSEGKGKPGLTFAETAEEVEDVLPAIAREIGMTDVEAGRKLQQELVEEFISSEAGVPPVAAVPTLGRIARDVKVAGSTGIELVPFPRGGAEVLRANVEGIASPVATLSENPSIYDAAIAVRVGTTKFGTPVHEVAHVLDFLLGLEPRGLKSVQHIGLSRGMALDDASLRGIREAIVSIGMRINKSRRALRSSQSFTEARKHLVDLENDMEQLRRMLEFGKGYYLSDSEGFARAFKFTLTRPKEALRVMPRFSRDLIKVAERLQDLGSPHKKTLGEFRSEELRRLGKIILRVLDPRAVALVLLAGLTLKQAEKEVREIEETF